MLLFLVDGTKMNLPAYLFHYLCTYVRNSTEKAKVLVAFPRLLSELFYQCRLIDQLKEFRVHELLHTQRCSFLTAENLCKVHKISKKNFIHSDNPLKKKLKETTLRGDVIDIYKNEPIEVIAHYIAEKRKEGVTITYDDLESEPDYDCVKKRKRTTKKKADSDSEGPVKKAVAKKTGKKTMKDSEKSKEVGPAEGSTLNEADKVGPFVSKVLDDSEIEDELPLRPRKKQGAKKPPSDSDQGMSNPSVAIPNIAQKPPITTTTPAHTTISIDDSQPINMILPNSSQVFPAFPKPLPNISNILTKQYAALQTQDQQNIAEPEPHNQHSDSLHHLEQHLHGEFAQHSIPHSSPQKTNATDTVMSDAITNSEAHNTQTLDTSTQNIPSDHPSPSDTDQDLIPHILQSEFSPRFTMILNPDPPVSLRPSKRVIQLTDSDSESDDPNEPESSQNAIPPPPPPPISNHQFEQISRNIYRKVKALHKIRYSLISPKAYILAWDSVRTEIVDAVYNLLDGDLEEMVQFQRKVQAWMDQVKQGYMRLPEKEAHHWQEDYLRERVGFLDSAISRHLRFSLTPGAMFVSKDIVESSITASELADVKKELAELNAKFDRIVARRDAMDAKQDEKFERLEAKQDALAADLKQLIANLTRKP
ncbi:hypothetical protein P8452_02762 [Trifolium repens]|nr:hypothetical protein P8452_02762 [Trifolium repens]